MTEEVNILPKTLFRFRPENTKYFEDDLTHAVNLHQVFCASVDIAIKSREHTKVACFSENFDSILMWSHYANSHKGVCLEYDTRANSEGRYSNPKLMKVGYSRTRPKVTLLELMKYIGFQQMQNTTFCSKELSGQVLERTHLSKSEQWKYENEWRWVERDEGDARYRIMLPMKVVSITVGARATDKTIGLCAEISRGRIPVYQINLSDDEFVFRRELIKTVNQAS